MPIRLITWSFRRTQFKVHYTLCTSAEHSKNSAHESECSTRRVGNIKYWSVL